MYLSHIIQERQGGTMGSDYEFPEQKQERQPGKRSEMEPKPITDDPKYRASGKLTGRRAIVTGGDSGIGRAVAILFAKEGAEVSVVYLDEHEDAQETREIINGYGKRCMTIAGDVQNPSFCSEAVARTAGELGGLDILVNNAGVQYPQQSILDITDEQLERTFRTNIFSMFYMTRAALPHMKEGGAIINSTSITAYGGHPILIDYSATKGAIVSFTRALSLSLADKGIRVNAVAPGPIWTPLIPSSFEPEHTAKHGKSTPMGRAGQPVEVAPSYLFLACSDSSYFSGQVLHPNGGKIVNG
jgi:NAD(P)-dependent dehydrogenase (short-subunit alcohol dehydrogenase family)